MAQPVAKFRAGAVSAALWENEAKINGRTVNMLKVTVERRFFDQKTDSWKSSGSFSRNEVPLVIFCLQKAFEKMIETEGEETPQEEVVQ